MYTETVYVLYNLRCICCNYQKLAADQLFVSQAVRTAFPASITVQISASPTPIPAKLGRRPIRVSTVAFGLIVRKFATSAVNQHTAEPSAT